MHPTKNSLAFLKLPSVLYKSLAQSWIDKEFPRHVFIETTANCNLSCSYCPRERVTSDMDFGLFERIVDECSQFGHRSFSLHLFGEPLLYPRIADCVRHIKKRNKKHAVLLTTNGTLLNRFIAELVVSGVDRIIWSWRRNNFTPETIDQLRKVGVVRILRQETPPEEVERWSGFPRVEIKDLHNYGGNIELDRYGLPNDPSTGRFPCYHLWLAPAIRWNGDITICCNDPHGKEVLGNYRDGYTLYKAWHDPRIMALREGHLRGNYGGICKGCDVWKTYPDMFFEFQKK